jgi:hypothetical protein
MSDFLDLLSEQTQSILAHATITVRQNGPAGPIDPATLQRVLDAGSAVDTDVPAIVGEPFVTRNSNDKLVRRVEFIVRRSALSHRPGRKGTIDWSTDADGQTRTWKIASVNNALDDRDWLILGERDA